MTVSKEFIENKKDELKMQIASAMVRTLVSTNDNKAEDRELYREVINLFLDYAMYADDWDETETKALASALSVYLGICREILKEQS